MKFTNEFKMLVLALCVVAAFGGLILNQFNFRKELVQMSERVNMLEQVKVTPTVTPTVSPIPKLKSQVVTPKATVTVVRQATGSAK